MPSVLVTGASRGLGRSIVELNPQRILSVIVDVTDAEHMTNMGSWARDRMLRPAARQP